MDHKRIKRKSTQLKNETESPPPKKPRRNAKLTSNTKIIKSIPNTKVAVKKASESTKTKKIRTTKTDTSACTTEIVSEQYASEKVDHNKIIWDDSAVLAQVEKVPLKLAQNFVALLTEGCTLPFIARYRKTAVDNLMPDR